MKNYIKIIAALLLVSMLIPCAMYAQKGGKKRGGKAEKITIEATVTDPQGRPINGAVVTADEGGVILSTDNKGSFRTVVPTSSSILVEAQGYESRSFEADRKGAISIVMEPTLLYGGKKDMLDLPSNLTQSRRTCVGAVDAIKGTELESYPDQMLSNTLQGKISGLGVLMQAGGLANNPAALYVRGQHALSDNTALVLVDGVERPLDKMVAQEIENVEVLKDATAKILYGSRAANGVILITTKKGAEHKRIIKVSSEYGVAHASEYPEFLNSYDYARLYNEARVNDGLKPLYSDADLEGYKNSTGVNDLRYPNVDYYKYFLRRNTSYRRTNLEFSGGNERARYSLIAGYTGQSGLQKLGKEPQNNRFNVRGALNLNITKYLSMFMNIAGVFNASKRAALNHADTFTALTTHRPNEYPLVIKDERVPQDENGYPTLGGSFLHPDNLYGSLVYGGNATEQNINGQFNLGMKLDLDQFVKGLSIKAAVAYDNYFYGLERLSTNAATYAQRWSVDATGTEVPEFTRLTASEKTDVYTLSSTSTVQTMAAIGSIGYKRNFGSDHCFSADLAWNYSRQQQNGTAQDLVNLNTVLRVDYGYKGRYLIEADVAEIGSSRFSGSNRFLTSYAGGLGWIVSEENFMKELHAVDFLKLKVSAGRLGYDASTPYFTYQNRWNDSNTVRIGNGSNPMVTSLENWANPDLKWETSTEINAGVEALLFNRRLGMEVNFFSEVRDNIISQAASLYSGVYGGMIPYDNYGKVRNQGVELSLNFSDKKGDFSYRVGANMIWSKNKILKYDEVSYPAYLSHVGKSTDAMFGYVSQGLFGRDVELASHVPQTFGSYQNGDIAYADLNHDNKIDELDRKVVGNSFPRTQLGLQINLAYKGFALYALGTAQLGVHTWLNNAYYWNYGEGKYSVKALDRYNETTNPRGSYPRLTTTQTENNFRNSDFWLANTSFFRLKNVELSYTFGYDKPLGVFKQIKLFLRGDNICLLSSLKHLDPEATNAGITNYPVFKTFTGGVAVTF